MLPISLTVRNFLSYKEGAPTLRLQDVHVACLCGANGMGKSALLDAITWALWGHARGQRQEQLVHHGQLEMSVELDFSVGADSYRVTRRYSRARRTPQSSLELMVQAGDDYRPVTGNTIAETQADIIRRVSMDYDTFVNSAFLVQGRADLFAMATPMHRKEVLTSVLGLGLYDRLEERAKQRARELRAVLDALAFEVDQLRERAARADETRAALAEAELALAQADAAVDSLTGRLQLLRGRVAHLEQRQAERVERDAEAQRARQRQAEEEAGIAGLRGRIAGWKGTIERGAQIEAGFAALQEARERVRALADSAQRALALQTELTPLESAVTHAGALLESRIAAQRERIDGRLAPLAELLPSLQDQQGALTAREQAMDSRRKEAETAAEEHRRLTASAQSFRQENDRLTELGKETRAKLNLLDHGHADGVACPLCDSPLGPEGVAQIKANYERDITEQLERYAEQKQRAEALEREADGARTRGERARRESDAEQQRIQEERGRLARRREEAEQAVAQLAQEAPLLREAEAALANGAYAQEEQAAARRLRERLAELAFDQAALDAAERQAREGERWEGERQTLATARERLDDDAPALERALGRAAEAENDADRAEQASAAIAEELGELPTYAAQRDAVEHELQEASGRRSGLQSHKGSLENEMRQVADAAAQLTKSEKRRDELARDAGAYADLALAFGKGGVQALLIESAIPRLEDEANDLLKQMTAGRMSLKLETQRERRTGRSAGAESVETLEIVIADELGTRSYEMFSGGERFRVDFALRIALSKLLAWRAGAPLPTLFIDEGFGTQDAEGRDRILDVIKAIEDRFQRILVITHMDEIKEAFPVRIEVTRGLEGSTFSMS